MAKILDKDRFIDIIKNGAKINIIGDSIAAGKGSSQSCSCDKVIFQDDTKKFYRIIAPNSWGTLFENYIGEKFHGCSVINNGGCGASSCQIYNNIRNLINEDDDIVFLMFGANDRKNQNGMNDLYENSVRIINFLREKNKSMILFSPIPSTIENEGRPNRLYHMDDVTAVLKNVAEKENILLVDNYSFILEYLHINNLSIEEIMFEEGCENDGLHPSDFVQKLMFENLKRVLNI